jgi:serine/threonine protein kinase
MSAELSGLLPLNIVKKVGAGGFGEVFIAKDTANAEFAVKVEPTASTAPQLEYEMKVYLMLRDVPCVPKVRSFWEDVSTHKRFLAFQKLGPNLEECKQCLYKSERLLWVATRLVYNLKQIHAAGVLHRDIKPENILIGPEDDPTKIGRETSFFFVDFGLSKVYINKDGSHIPFLSDKKMSGTARYASLNLHRGRQQSRRDDLESLGYVFVYLYRGTLPWIGLRHSTSAKTSEVIGEMKASMSLEKLCEKCPPQLLQYLKYVRGLDFAQSPDYGYLERCLHPSAS